MTADVKQFSVYCIKADGKRVLFSTYATRLEGEAIVAALRRVKCLAVFHGPIEQALDDEVPT
jgi:hypothetical protein